jgi:hypothetical protein
VQDWAQGLKRSYLECRELGHNWRPHVVQWNDNGGYDRSLRCTRCRTVREQVLSNRGAVISSQYVYPDGYTTDGLGRVVGEGRDMLRLESITRDLGSE